MVKFFTVSFGGYNNLVQHGFFTRTGGVSSGVFDSLNCAYSREPKQENVTENRRRAIEAIQKEPESLCTARQVHGAQVIEVKEKWTTQEIPKADGLVTKNPNVTLGILTADCVPILFLDPIHKVIGAAHAGWRGAFSGIIEQTIQKMETLGAEPSTIYAAIGPCIAQDSYEVSLEFYNTFVKRDLSNKIFFKQRAHKYYFDLLGYAKSRLNTLGLAKVEALEMDTYQNPDLFFSCRRATHKGEDGFGNLLSAIALRQ